MPPRRAFCPLSRGAANDLVQEYKYKTLEPSPVSAKAIIWRLSYLVKPSVVPVQYACEVARKIAAHASVCPFISFYSAHPLATPQYSSLFGLGLGGLCVLFLIFPAPAAGVRRDPAWLAARLATAPLPSPSPLPSHHGQVALHWRSVPSPVMIGTYLHPTAKDHSTSEPVVGTTESARPRASAETEDRTGRRMVI